MQQRDDGGPDSEAAGELSGQHYLRFKVRTMQGCKGKQRSRKAAGLYARAAESMTVPFTEMVTTKEHIWSARIQTFWDT